VTIRVGDGVAMPHIACHAGTEKVMWIQSWRSCGKRASPRGSSGTGPSFPGSRSGQTRFRALYGQRWPDYVFADIDWTAVSSPFRCEDCKAGYDSLTRIEPTSNRRPGGRFEAFEAFSVIRRPRSGVAEFHGVRPERAQLKRVAEPGRGRGGRALDRVRGR
jgi:hypothetical protein